MFAADRTTKRSAGAAVEASRAASAFCACSEAVPGLDKAGSSDDCAAIDSVRASTSSSDFGDSVMRGTEIGLAIAGEDDAGVCPLCPAIFTASAESQTLTAYSTAPLSHNQASVCFTSGLHTGVPARPQIKLRRLAPRINSGSVAEPRDGGLDSTFTRDGTHKLMPETTGWHRPINIFIGSEFFGDPRRLTGPFVA